MGISLITAVGGGLGIMVAWQTLDLPVIATSQELHAAVDEHAGGDLRRFASVDQYARQTRVLALSISLGSLETRLDRLDAQIAENPGNPELKILRRQVERQIRRVQKQIDTLTTAEY